MTDVVPVPASPAITPPPVKADEASPEARDLAMREINARRVQVENPELLRRLRSL